MTEKTTRLTGWAIAKIERDYPKDVALLIGQEHHETDHDGHGVCFDYFVPATERGNNLAQTFIVDGVGHDLYPRTWERCERTANLQDWATFTMGDFVKILWSRSPEDVERFRNLQQKLRENLANPALMFRKALEHFDDATELYRKLLLEDSLANARMAAAYMAANLANAMCDLNGTYRLWQNRPWSYTLGTLKELPEGFTEDFLRLRQAADIPELRAMSEALLRKTRAFLLDRKPDEPKPAPDWDALADWYGELSLTWRRIRFHIREGQIESAYENSVYLQNEVREMGRDYGLARDLLDAWDERALMKFVERIDEVEREYLAALDAHGVAPVFYKDVDAFLKENV